MSHHDDVDQPLERFEVRASSGVQRKALRSRCRRDQEVNRTCSSSVSSSGGGGSIDATIGTGGLGIEGKRLEDSLGTLESILSTTSLAGVIRRVRAGR